MNTARFEDYRLEIRPVAKNEGGGFLVTMPDLPGCMSDGETYEKAIANARDAFEGWIEAWQQMGRKVPVPNTDDDDDPTKFVLRMPHSLHVRVMATATAEGVSANMLLSTIIAEGITVRAPRKSIAQPNARYRTKKAATPARRQSDSSRRRS